MDREQLVGELFADFNKTFDTLLHNLLLQKLSDLGIRGDIN